jgi:cation diffusion facilitator family transporter
MSGEKQQVALGSMVASGGLTLAKLAVGLTSGSLAILSEAAHSALDFVATVMTYFAVRIADKPADEQHHYGHGKVESVAALAETGLLFVLSAFVIWEAGHRLAGSNGHVVEATLAAFAVIIVSIVVDYFRARLLYRVAAETRSQALEADALHFGSDMWSSLAVLIGLGAVWLGYPWADSAAAIVVAVFICIAGWRLGKRTIDTLVDAAPAGAAERIAAITEQVPGVVTIERVRARPVGAVLFVEITVAVSRTLPLDRVMAIKTAIAAAIVAEMPEAEVNVTADARALDDESVLERVMVIARNRALAVHHVTAHTIGGKLAISLDLEVDGRLSLAAAHEIATALETAVQDDFGVEVEVETHIEPLQGDGLAGRDAAPAHADAVSKALAEITRDIAFIDAVHDVRVRETAEGEIVNFHCHVDAALTVHDVHEKVDEVERALRRRFPTIKRVIGHAEPH